MNFLPHEIEKKVLVILQILNEAQEPVGARVIARHIQVHGVMLSERAVRYHLKLMDERGLTRLVGRRDGRVITEKGIDELRDARVRDKVGFAITRIELLAFRTTFDPKSKKGSIPVNLSFFSRETFKEALEAMKPAFEEGICVSDLVAVAYEGERLGEAIVPAGKVGLATVCSIVVNGTLLKAGVPMDSKFGGILQIKDRNPLRFVELIYYAGSSMDPSEAFIRANMTSVREVAEGGEGKVLVNFREIPALCRSLVEDVLVSLRKVGIGGVLSVGEVGGAVCEIPVDLNKVGMILIGGLNPVACAQEAGIEAENRAMSTVMDYQDLESFLEISKKT